MLIGNDLAAALPQLRKHAESRMTSTCTIRRKTGNTVIVDNREVPEWIVIHTDLPVRVVSVRGEARSRGQSPGDVEVERTTPRDDFPAAVSRTLRADDFVEIDTGENASDVHRLVAVSHVDQATACRCPVEAVERPKEWGQ